MRMDTCAVVEHHKALRREGHCAGEVAPMMGPHRRDNDVGASACVGR
jgi:hypothetical protein